MSDAPSLSQCQSEFLLALQGHEGANKYVSPKQRLKVYSHSHQGALLKALTDTFSLTNNLLNKPLFHDLCVSYIQSHPSTSENLNLYGHEFSEFLSKKNLGQLIVDVANYEYQRVNCYYASNSTEFPIEYFESMSIESKLAQGFIKQESVIPIKSCFDITALNTLEAIVDTGFQSYLVLYREIGKVKAVPIDNQQYDFLTKFKKPYCLQDLSESELVLLPDFIVKNWLKLVEFKV
jgi:hypothetical protein